MDILRRVQRGAFASHVLGSSLSPFSPQDKGFITDVVYGTLRQQIYLDACLKPNLKRPDKLPEDVRNALRAGTYELLLRGTPRHAGVGEWVSVVKKKQPRLAGLVNAVLRKVEPLPNPTPSELASVPDWLYEDWRTLFGDKAAEVAKGMLEPEPLWLSVYDERAADSLENEGCTVASGPLDNTLAIKPSRPLNELSAFKKGWIQPQNPSSREPVLALNVKADERVLDLASGNGIKAAQLANMGANVVSVEIDTAKVERAKANLGRLGLKVEHHVHDLTKKLGLEPALKVLLDAPCSGTGTLRGHPEIKLRLEPKDVSELAALQAKLLTNSAELCSPGGTLVYAVCALTSQESITCINAFLETHPDFKVDPYEAKLPHLQTPQGSFILPTDGLDGFFISVLKQTATHQK